MRRQGARTEIDPETRGMDRNASVWKMHVARQGRDARRPTPMDSTREESRCAYPSRATVPSILGARAVPARPKARAAAGPGRPRTRAPAALGAVGILILAAAGPAQNQGKSRGRPPQLRPMPVPHALVEHRRGARITVDGVLQDWPETAVILLDDTRQLSGTALGAWRGPADLAARAFALWDEKAFWFAIKVRDDWHRPLTEKTPRLQEIPPADSVVLTFDPRRDTRAIGPDEGRKEDREFWIAEVAGQGRRLVLWDRFRGTARFAEGAAMAAKRDDERGITTYEVKIPWSEILPGEVKPRPSAVFDLQIVVNDLDEVTDPMPQTRIGWTFGTGPIIDPGLLGSIMLVTELRHDVEHLPDFPPPREPPEPPVPPPPYWAKLDDELASHPPSPIGPDSPHLSEAGGVEHRRALQKLEHHLARFPRVDYLEYHQRVHRRMRRECAGMVRTGLLHYYQHVLARIGRRTSTKPTAIEIIRLPESGFLVRSPQAIFAIDPSGYALERHLWKDLSFVILTNPLDPTKRNDQLLIRLAASNRRFFTHIAFHLPRIPADRMPLVKLGETYTLSGLRIRPLGRVHEKGWLPATAAYVVEWPNGFRLVHSGGTLGPEMLESGRRTDVLLLSAKHPRARLVGQGVAARTTILADVLQCSVAAGPNGRVRLEEAYELQRALLPWPSVLLAPGDVWRVPD